MLIKTIFGVTVLLLCQAAIAQSPLMKIVRGVVINDSTGEGLRNATVQLKGSSLHTLTNETGQFILKWPHAENTDSIQVSHIGYRSSILIVNARDTNAFTVRMHPETEQLEGVVVKTAVNPLALISKAIALIPKNYPQQPYLSHGFYRWVGCQDKNVIDVSEAVFDLYNESYAAKGKQFKLVKTRFEQDFVPFKGLEVGLGSSPGSIIDDDLVADIEKSDLLNKSGLKDHQFFYKGIVNYNGKKAYEIWFDQKDGVKRALFEGKLFLGVDDMAFLQVSMHYSAKGLKYWEPPLFTKVALMVMRVKWDILHAETIVAYNKYGSYYYLDHVRSDARWHLSHGRRIFDINPLNVNYHYVVTGIDTSDAKPFARKEIVRRSKLVESLSPDKLDSTDEVFWRNYNVLKADFNVDSAVHVMQAHNASLNQKQNVKKLLSHWPKDKAIRIDSILSYYYAKGQFNGTALVQYKGKVILAKGYGMADKERNMPNAPTTQFRIGSTSKQFTAMLIMQLVNKHALQLSDTIGKFLPGYVNGRVTVAQLLTHSSGIPNYLEDPTYQSKVLTQAYPLNELIRQFCSDSLEFDPGTAFHYSNSGYVLLAAIAEKLTGKTYAELLQEHIFHPLGMQQSYFGEGAHDTTNMAQGYIAGMPAYRYPEQNVVGAGSIVSSANDLLLWANSLTTSKLLPTDLLKEMFVPRMEWNEWGAWYGYGWMIDRLQFAASGKHVVQYHPGTELAFYTMLARQPDKNIVIILLNNSEDFPRFDMTDLILSTLN